MRRSDRNAWLGKAAVACRVYYFLAILALHAIQRDVNPLNVFMSEYVLGRAGFLMTTTFFVWAVGLAALALALRDTLTLLRWCTPCTGDTSQSPQIIARIGQLG